MSSFIWYELMTDDADRAARFYTAVFGWKIAGGAPGKTGPEGYRQLLRSDGGSAGGLLPLSADMVANGARPAWLPYLYVADVAAALAAIVSDGGRVVMPAMSLPVGTVAMVADPQGVPLYVMTPVPPPGKPDAVSDVFSPTALQRVAWNELSSPDLAASKAFYARRFGFEFNEVMSMGAMGDYCFIDQQGVRLGAIMPRQDARQPAAWLMHFRVPSVLDAKRAIEAGGGKVLHGPMEVPGGDWIVVATDPGNAPFGVVGAKGQS